jgi:hypothetical protein
MVCLAIPENPAEGDLLVEKDAMERLAKEENLEYPVLMAFLVLMVSVVFLVKRENLRT